jgi:PAS domain S-box-containing protein
MRRPALAILPPGFGKWGDHLIDTLGHEEYGPDTVSELNHESNHQDNKATSYQADPFSFSELRYRRLFEAARDGILIVDPETRQIVDVNPFLVEFLGYPFEEFIGKELYEIGMLRDEATSKLAFDTLLENGYVRYEDMPLRAKDGRKLAVEFVSNVYLEGDRQIIQCNIRDISTRKHAESALRESEERFKLVARTVSDVIWDWNIKTDSLWWSDGFMTTFGYENSEIEPGRASWKCRVHPNDLDRVVGEITDALETGADFWKSEYRFRRRDGAYASVLDKGYILRDVDGAASRMVGGIRDLTDQKNAEVQTARAHRMESIGTLAGGIAHDLNNVLTPVMMSIELLKGGADAEPGRREILDAIQVSCRRGADLVRQVLSFARGLDGQRIQVRLPSLISEIKKMVGESFPSSIKIVTKVSEDLWQMTGDPVQLHQVILNLAVNARDAMPKGGTLTISAENVNLDPRDLGSSRQSSAGRQILLQVSDTGVGITQANYEHIFEPFFTTKKIGEGTGFGLAIVHTIVKGHGGFVIVESEVGHGTTFKVWLPADPLQRTVESLPPYQADMPRGNGELVLVVDDEFTIRDLTERNLESLGYCVITASNGAEALATYCKRSKEIALVITDMMMPVMDGAAAVREIRRMNPSAKMIVVSGLDVDDELKSKVNGFLAKPYSGPELAQIVHEVLENSAVRK